MKKLFSFFVFCFLLCLLYLCFAQNIDKDFNQDDSADLQQALKTTAQNKTDINSSEYVDFEDFVDDFMVLRMQLTTMTQTKDNFDILEAIDDWQAKNKATIQSLPYDKSLAIQNLLLMEKYNYQKDQKQNKKMLRAVLKAQKDIVDDYLEENKKKESDITKWLFCTAADLTSCYISFSLKDTIKYGLSIKKLYQKALEKDEYFCYCLTNIAQWYYWAPHINGGSKKKALSHFLKAGLSAKTKAQTFFSQLFLSQILFETKEQEQSQKALALAKNICPQSKTAELYEKINLEGISFFDYSKNHSNMEESDIKQVQ